MTVDIAQLGIAVDTTQVKQATVDLDNLGNSGAATAEKVKVSNTAFTQFNDCLTGTERAAKQAAEAAAALAAQQQALGTNTNALTIGQQLFMDKLRDQAAAAGLSKTALLELQAAEMGMGDAAAPLIAQIEAATTGMSHFSLANAGATRELAVLGREIANGNVDRLAGSMSVLASRTGLLPMLFSPLGLGLLAIGAVVAVVAYELINMSAAIDKFNTSLILTNNYAGQTRDSMAAMAVSIQTSATGGIGKASEMLAGLAASGKFTGGELAAVGQTALKFADLTGQSSDQVIKYFSGMSGGVAAWADTANQSYHFMDAAQYEHIATLEKEGKSQQAVIEVMRMMNDAMDTHGQHVGILTAVYKGWGLIIDDVEGALQKMVFPTTGEDVQKAITDLANMQKEAKAAEDTWGAGPAIKADWDVKIADQRKKIHDLIAASNAEEIAAGQKQEKDLYDMRGVAAQKDWDQTAQNLRTQQQLRTDAVTKIRADAEAINADAEKNGKARVISEQQINDMIALSDAQYADKQVKDNSSNLILQNAIKANADMLTSEKAKYDAMGAMDDLYHKYGVTSDDAYYKQKADLALAYEQAQIASYDKDLALLTDHDNKDYDEQLKTQKQIDDLYAKKQLAVQKYNSDLAQYAAENTLRNKAAADAEAAADQKTLDGLTKTANATVAMLGNSDKYKESLDRLTIAKNQSTIAQYDNYLESEKELSLSSQEVATAEAKITALKAQNAALGLTADALDELAKRKIDAQQYKDASAAAKEMATDLSTSFGSVGDAIGKMTEAYTTYGKTQHDILVQYQKDMADANVSDNKDALEKAAKDKLSKDSAVAEVKNYGDMAEAASQFFDKSTTGYKVMQDVEKAFRIAEAAMQAEALAVKLTSLSAGAAADNEATGASVTNSGLRAAADGVAAVAKAIASMPFPMNLVAGAATLAALVALGVQIDGSLGGGGSSPDTSSAASQQKTQGTGTSMSDVTKQSDSLVASMTLLTSNSSAMLPLTSQMASSLQSIVNGISGVANILSGTPVSAASMGIDTGKLSSSTSAELTSAVDHLNEALGGPGVGGAINGFLGSLTNKISNWIGGSTTKSVTDSGIQLSGTVGQLSRGQGISDYANVNTQVNGGWFHESSNSNSVVTGATDAQTQQSFGLIFSQLESTFSEAATAIGANATAVGNAVAQIPVQTNISLQGLTGTALTTALQAVLSKQTDLITSSLVSQNLLPNLNAFAQVGEGYLTTLVRVSSGIEQADTAMSALGLTAISYTDIINKQGNVATEIERQTIIAAQTLKDGVLTGVGQIIQSFTGSAADLVTLYTSLKAMQTAMGDVALNANNLSGSTLQGAGGQQNLQQGLADYLKYYFSPAEQSAAELKDLSAQFSALGEVMPTNLAGFRAMVSGIDTSTAAGQKLQGGLLNLAGAFNTAMADSAALTTATTASSSAAATATSAMTALLGEMDQVTTLQKSLAGSVQSIAQNAPGYDMGGYLAGNVTTAQTTLDNAPADNSSASLTARISAAGDLQNAIMASYNYQQDALNQQVQAEQAAHSADIAAQNQAISAANALASSFKAIGTYATGLLTGDLSDLSGKQKSSVLQATYQSNLAGAQNNDPTAIAALTNSADAYLKDKLASASTMQQYATTFQQVQSQLSGLGARGDVTLQSVVDTGFTMSADLQKKMIDLQSSATAQLKVVQDKTTAWQDSLQASMTTQVTAFDNLGLTANEILSALTGLDTRIGAAVAASITASATSAAATGTATSAAITVATGASTSAASSPASSTDAAKTHPIPHPVPRPIPAFADGGVHTGGWAITGEHGPELTYSSPSQIMSNGASKSLFNTDEMVAELKALRVAVAALQKAADKSAKSNATVENIFQRVTLGGTSIQTQVATS